MRESNPRVRFVGPPSFHWTNRPWSRRRESNPHFEAYETSKVAVPSLRIGGGGLGGNRTLIPWVQARDPPVKRRARDGPGDWSARGDTRSGSAYGNRTRPSALATRDAPCTPRPNVDRWRSPAFRRPSVVKDPALASWWATTPVLATAPGFEPGPESVGGSDASVTPRCQRHASFRRQNLPHKPRRAFSRVRGQNKKGLLGERPRRPGSR